MRKIFKYTLQMRQSPQSVAIPFGAEILTAQLQISTGPNIWAIVNPEAETEIRWFQILNTGETMAEIRSAYNYLGTFQMNHGLFIFHVFELLNYKP